MSEQPTPAATETPPPAATPPAPDPTDAAGWEQRYRTEVADRIRERNLYKAPMRLLADLDEDSRNELVRLADMARNQDADGIIEWSLSTAEQLSGKDIAAIVAARQKQGDPAPSLGAPAPAAPVEPPASAAEIAKMVQAEMAKAKQLEDTKREVSSKLTTAGYPVDSAPGQTIIQYAMQNNADLDTAIAWFENDMTSSVLTKQRAAAAAAGTVPGTAPSGAPVGTVPDNATDREKAMARLQRANAERATA